MEVVYGITSLSPERGTPEQLLALVRGHWQIENKLHWVRDVTFDEDRSQVRCGPLWEYSSSDGSSSQYHDWAVEMGRLLQHCGRVPSLRGPTGPGIEPHWY
jgi:Transposase DDE domain